MSFSDFEFRISNFDLRPILPAKPEKVDGKKWYEPAELVLLVDRPFAAELSPKYRPENG